MASSSTQPEPGPSAGLSPAFSRRLEPAALWLVFCAFCSCAGWALSVVHGLTTTGYALAFGAGIVALGIWARRTRTAIFFLPVAGAWRRRWRRLCPLVYLSLAVLAFAGGVFHGPTNYDGLAYRVPRVLHWLAEGRWHWIETPFNRVNTHSPGFEWISAPLLAFTRTDRLFFLINTVSFCLLPGLLFGCFHRLGIKRRVAYAWMWLLPSGYCFLLQAGSIGNDLFVATLAVASFYYALRARESGRVTDLYLSILAAGLFTGAKANSIPLLLAWCVAVAPSYRLLFRRWGPSLALGAVALAASFFPMAVMNWKYCGDWTGAKAEELHFTGTDLGGRLFGNAVIIVMNNFAPPIAPFAGYWNHAIAPRLVPEGLRSVVARDFDIQDPLFGIDEMQVEEGAGLGFGVCLLLLVSTAGALVSSWRGRQRTGSSGSGIPFQWLVIGATGISVLAVMKMAFAKSTTRLLSPYYPLMVVPLLLCSGHARIIRRRWWSFCVVVVWAMAAVLLVANPARPLFPAARMVDWMRQKGWSPSLVARADRVYSVYGRRHDAFAPVIAVLPADATVLGMVTFDDPEAPLWWPYGSRRIVHVGLKDTPETLKQKGVRYVLISPEKFAFLFQAPLEPWLDRFHGKIIRTIPMTLRAGGAEVNWLLVELSPTTGP